MTDELRQQVEKCEYCVISHAPTFKLPKNSKGKETCRLYPNWDRSNTGRGSYSPCDFLIENGYCPNFGTGRFLVEVTN